MKFKFAKHCFLISSPYPLIFQVHATKKAVNRAYISQVYKTR